MIEGYLSEKWRDGALAGATAEEAYFVRLGVDTTMTAPDTLDGRINVEAEIAV